MDYELVIIGAGPAGCGAALYGAREGLTTLLLEPAAPGGQMSVTAWVENYPGVPGTSGPQLAEAMLAGAKAAGATQRGAIAGENPIAHVPLYCHNAYGT